MINFEKYRLDNGLKVILHVDGNTPLVAVNVAYNVGSRDESPEHTGFAHLFEHLMFGGSKNIPDFDTQLQKAGGESNAFTNTDLTDYYLTIPAANLETALWLESDRMNELAFSKKSLEIQRQVVIEEFKQNYLNQPYGDVMLLLKPLAYQVHPYKWNTIGKEIGHIENAKMEEVKEFFSRFYRPVNAILSIAGNIDIDKTKQLVSKWFENIPAGTPYLRNLPSEPEQMQPRFMEVERKVPNDLLVKAFHCCRRADSEFYPTDMVTDILSTGKSSRLQQHLVEDNPIFSNVSCYVTGTFDEGLLIISGNPNKGVSLESADAALQEELVLMRESLVSETELLKIKNKIRTLLYYADLQVQDKAMNLAVFEMIDQAERYDWEEKLYDSISAEQIQSVCKKLFVPNNSSTLYYKAEN